MASGETIAAIATPPGRGAIAIVRASGPDVRTLAERVFAGPVLVPRVATYGTMLDPTGAAIDRGLALLFAGPASYTGEDMLELHVHGSPVVAREVLRALVAHGARLAGPGEFTQRAFLAGKLDLSEAEAVADVIEAESRGAAVAATARLAGGVRTVVESIRSPLAITLEQLAGAIDFPDEVPEPERGAVAADLAAIDARLGGLVAGWETGRLVREGLGVAIVGPPNAGKSSLLNALLGADRALVSDIAGTTRDTIEETIGIDGVLVRLTDTAGLRLTDDPLERAGIERTRASLAGNRLALVVIDGSRPLDADARTTLDASSDRPRIVFRNKSDLGVAPADTAIPADAIIGSVFDPLALAALRTAIAQLGWGGEAPDFARPHLASVRQADAVAAAQRAIAHARATITGNAPIDLAAPDLLAASAALGLVSGAEANEAVVTGIFARFCIGK
jgi:tRNA modification GTPase